MRRRALLGGMLVVAAFTQSACRRQKGRRPRFARTAAGGGVHLVYEIDFARAWEGGNGREVLLARTIEVLRARVAGLVEGGVVQALESGSGIDVFLPAGPPEMSQACRRIARLPGRFRVQLVDDGSAFMVALVQRVRAASPAGVEVSADHWTDPGGGRTHTDPCLAAEDRQRLIDVLAADAAHNPVPSDREILLEHAGAKWRSYYVIKSGGIDNADIDDAAPGTAYDGRPELEIVLTAGGRRKFADLTTRSVGRKMVMVIDGTIQTAPILMTPIAGGRIRVLTGHDPSVERAVIKQDVEDLAAALRSGPLPAPLMFMVEEQVARLP